ncbi:gastric triacylglycerol lipase-like [Colias croceus]|uniref:gastric triacylglycerol lipase-like n=1 Tax=Colias crocea TaxID=72248 RepID=UPI001E28049A|nr:gastric triacylglycerol lipase-like [Colias croceus]
MASKANVTVNVLLISVAIILGNVVRFKFLPFNNDTKKSLGYPKDSLLNFTELAGKYGYISEEHTVITEDDYVLTIFRIVRGRNCHGRIREPPVILMHGLLQSSDAWLDAGPNAGLAYLLADACYDVWVGNQRGNYYARRHLHYNPDKHPQFWDFSVDEIGLYDIPATIDYVLNYTGLQKLNYIGYSQGSGTFFVMCSERPGYCDKVNLLIGLAPAARQTYTKSVIYRIVSTGISTFETALTSTGLQEVFAKGALGQELLGFICQVGALSEPVCGTAEGLFDSFHPGSISNETLRVMFGHFPAGTSVRNMARYGQSMMTDKFQKFDYGKAKNLKKYGCQEPPKYNLNSVTVPMVIMYGKNDYLVDPKDIKWLVDNLPNVLQVKQVADPLWNHFDNTYSRYTNELIFPTVHHYLLKFSR